MSKTIKVISIVFLGFLLIISLAGFGMWQQFKKSQETHEQLKSKADYIIDNLHKSEVIKEFPEKYFPKEQLNPILNQIKQNCDWQNRDGKYVDFFSAKNIGGTDQISFIYEYYLKCDSVRFILTYNLNEDNPELFKLHFEPLEVKNSMILFPEKQLKNRK